MICCMLSLLFLQSAKPKTMEWKGRRPTTKEDSSSMSCRKRNSQGQPRTNNNEHDGHSCFPTVACCNDGSEAWARQTEDGGQSNTTTVNLLSLPPQAIRSRFTDRNTDKLTAHEMNALSLQDRQRIYEELHGIPSILQEEDLPMLLEAFHARLATVLRREKKAVRAALDRATFLRPAYVHQFKIPFLRAAQKYNIHEAVRRFVDHFRIKQELFGSTDVLVRDIRYSDLSAQDRLALNGADQALRDRAGRFVLCANLRIRNNQEPDNWFRAYWYLMLRELRDEEAQRRGVVFIANLNTVGSSAAMWNMDYYARVGDINEALPLRIVGIHFCWNDKRWQPILSLTQMVVGDTGRVRFRSHFGSPLETQYELMAFGIPAPNYEWPVAADGSIGTAQFQAYLARAQQDEETQHQNDNTIHPQTGQSIVLAPNPIKDILFGTGRPVQESPANAYLLRWLDLHHVEPYMQLLSQEEKTCYNIRILHSLHADGYRFLKRVASADCATYGWEEGCWMEVTFDEARAKISRTLRNIKHSCTNKSILGAFSS